MSDDLQIVESKPLQDLSIVSSEPLPPQGSAVHRFFAPTMAVGKTLFHGVDAKNPLSFDSLKAFGSNLVDSVKALPEAQQHERDAMHEAWSKGNHMEAVAHGMAAMTPVLGPMAQQAADKWIAGDHAGALGTFALMAAPEAGEAGGLLKKGAGAVASRAAEGVADTGAARLLAEHPKLASGAGTAVGGMAGGAVGGHIGAVVGSYAGHEIGDALPGLIKEAQARGAARSAAREAAANAPPPENPAVTRVREAFDPATARPAPPTTAPGNAVYEHGPVDVPMGAGVAPGAAEPAGAAKVKPIDIPRVTVQQNSGPIKPASGLTPSDEVPAFEPPHPLTKYLAENPEALAAAKAFRDALPEHAIPESFTDQNTSGLQIQPEIAHRGSVASKTADYFQKNQTSPEEILSRKDQPAAWQMMWDNAARVGKVSSRAKKPETYSHSPAAQMATMDEIYRRIAEGTYYKK